MELDSHLYIHGYGLVVYHNEMTTPNKEYIHTFNVYILCNSMKTNSSSVLAHNMGMLQKVPTKACLHARVTTHSYASI